MMTDDDLRAKLRAMIDAETAAVLAARWGFERSHLSRVVNGHLPITDRLAGAMGYERGPNVWIPRGTVPGRVKHKRK
jgi:hypothetical protein